MMYARMNGGGEKNIDPGFKVMKDDINPNVLGLRALARQDDGAVPVGPGPDRGMGHRPRAGLRQHRLPVDFIYPKEGAPILLASACPVASFDQPAGA